MGNSYVDADKDSLSPVMIDFWYQQFLLSQESLGEEFEEVLFKNLWNLYEE